MAPRGGLVEPRGAPAIRRAGRTGYRGPPEHTFTVVGSLVGTRNDLRECFDLHAQGRTRVVAEKRRLEDVNACFDEVLSGKVPTRLVFDLAD